MIMRSLLLSLFLAICQCSTSTAKADSFSPDLIPPEIVLPTPNTPATVPGTGSAPAQQSPYLPQFNKPNVPPPAPGPTVQQPASSQANTDSQKSDPTAIIETDKGTITIHLFASLAPKTVSNFKDLVDKGFYNGLTFHRVEPGFCIQGGCPNGDGSGVYFEPDGQKMRFVELEVNSSLRHNVAGVVAMAHFPKNPNTASCQFYITLSPQPSLDGKYSIFGGVTDGMAVVNKIAKGDKINRITIQEQE